MKIASGSKANEIECDWTQELLPIREFFKKPEGDVHPEDVTGKTIQQDHDVIKNLMKVWTVSFW